MTTLSIRLPDDMAQRLKSIAKLRDMSLNTLMLELSSQVLAEEEAKQRFLTAQSAASPSVPCNCWTSWIPWGSRLKSLLQLGSFETFLKRNGIASGLQLVTRTNKREMLHCSNPKTQAPMPTPLTLTLVFSEKEPAHSNTSPIAAQTSVIRTTDNTITGAGLALC